MLESMKKPVRKKFECQSVYNKVMANHFYELDEASRTGSKKIAWCTSVGPAELLRGMGFLVYFRVARILLLSNVFRHSVSLGSLLGALITELNCRPKLERWQHPSRTIMKSFSN